MEKIFLENVSKHMKGKRVNGTGHHGFTKAYACLTNLIAFYNEMTGLVNEARAADVYPSLCKAFDTVSSNIDKLKKYGLGMWTVRWTGNWQND